MTQCCFSYIVLYNSIVSCFFSSQALDIFIIKKKTKTTKMASFPKSLSVHYAMNNLAFTTTWTLKPIAHPGLRQLSLLVQLFVVCLFLTVASDLVDHHPFPPNVASWKDHRVRLYRSGKKVSPYILLSDEIWEQQVVAVSSHFFAKIKNKIKYNANPISQRPTPCCDDYCVQWCPQVKGSPSGWGAVAGRSLSWVWRGLRRKTPGGTRGKGKLSPTGRCFIHKFGLQSTYKAVGSNTSCAVEFLHVAPAPATTFP